MPLGIDYGADVPANHECTDSTAARLLVCVRFPWTQRLLGRKVRFVTGTDEHGEKIALAAQKRGMTPQQHCDDIVGEYKSLWQEVRALVRSDRPVGPQGQPTARK